MKRVRLIAMVVVACAAIPAASDASGVMAGTARAPSASEWRSNETSNAKEIEAATASYRCGSSKRQFGAGHKFGDKIPIKHRKFAFTFTSSTAKVVFDGTVTKRLSSVSSASPSPIPAARAGR